MPRQDGPFGFHNPCRGDPDSCIKALKLHEAAGCDKMMIMMQTETIPHQKVMKSLELFGKYVALNSKKGGSGKIWGLGKVKLTNK